MPKGHVVAVRITAENPDQGFKPSSGTLQELNFRSSTNVWGYFSVGTAGGLHEFADSQFGHIFAYGADRSESRKAMIVALKELSIRGDFRTTVEYLIKLLETEAFESNTITTGWLDTLISANMTAERPDNTLAVICGAVTKAHLQAVAACDEYKRILDKGQVPDKNLLRTAFTLDFIYENIKYQVLATRSAAGLYTLFCNGGKVSVGLRTLADGGLLVLLDGRSHTVYWREEVGALRLMVNSKTCLIEQESDPTQLRSPSPGKLVRFLVESGAHVKAGQAYAEIEVMKMYMPLLASEDGVPQFVKQPGTSLEAGDILGVLTLDDPSRVKHAQPFAGQLPPMGLPSIVGSKPHQQYDSLLKILYDILDGYDNVSVMQSTLKELMVVLQDPELPYGRATAILSTLSGRMPAKLEASIRTTLEAAHSKGSEFPSPRLRKVIDSFLDDGVRPQDRQTVLNTLAPLSDVINRFKGGLKSHGYLTLSELMGAYHSVESIFSSNQEDDIILQLRDQNRDSLDEVVRLVLSHSKCSSKNQLILAVLDIVSKTASQAAVETTFHDSLSQLAQLDSKAASKVALKAKEEQYPSYFTLRKDAETKNWEEVVAIRDIEPALAFQLELSRLSNFHVTPCPTENRQIHIYYAEGKENSADSRFFVRTIVRPGRIKGSIKVADYLVAEAERLLNDALNALEVVSATRRGVDVNHVTLNFVYGIPIGFEELQAALAGFLERHGKRLWRLRVTAAEVRLVIEDESGSPQAIRVMIDNLSGFVVKFEAYKEVTTEKGKTILKSIGPVGAYHLQPVNFPYPTKEWLQPKRFKAHVVGTTYCYDFPDLFRQAARREWKRRTEEIPFLKPPADPLVATELVQDEYGTPQEVSRPPGRNTVGMVAWMFVIKTPQFPNGRRMIVIANDITFKIGSFGPAEDDFFYRVTELAQKLGVPRIYLSANSGARLGIADEVTDQFCAAWNEPENPSKGFKFLYLTQDSVKRLKEKGEENVVTEEVEYEGQLVHQIKAVIGSQDGLGVESLRGSGLIAGGTSRAYNDIFTITLVTARSVGIGAYLVRLGQRAVQVEGQPIILTGASALNKVLGREVYSSNLQLGGTQIMHRNGVSHLTASNDLEGVSHILDWMSYIPECRGGPLPITSAKDSWDRAIDYVPIKGSYDPRWFLAGKEEIAEDAGTGESRFLSGFFDKGSFQETLSGWAQTVVVGRARLGGIPMGCIAVETRTIEKVIPADPANPSSVEQKIMEAGQVWYPNSSHKTAQAIEDFNREELPLIIFANWRGFSGGQQDMFDEVLKRGSMIVDGLSSYKQPVFVYIIPNGELRGGAWVVLDPSINPSGMMEMYADKTSRAGVLEPEGIVEIKFRKAKILEMMNRLDPRYAELKIATSDMSKSLEELSAIKNELAAREKQLSGTYTAMALQFADLHDRTERMKAKGTIREALDWSESRRYFYWRLRRRLLEEEILKKLDKAERSSPSVVDRASKRVERMKIIEERFLHDLSLEEIQTNDQAVCSKIEERTKLVDALITETESASLENQIQGLINTKSNLVFESIKKVFGDRLSSDEISVLSKLSNNS
ncbi:hypothetical protein PtB15_14B64 [Puccinia triticina]|nr:hypothetical protein PtB15_14B64 [Puccinia triticina]